MCVYACVSMCVSVCKCECVCMRVYTCMHVWDRELNSSVSLRAFAWTPTWPFPLPSRLCSQAGRAVRPESPLRLQRAWPPRRPADGPTGLAAQPRSGARPARPVSPQPPWSPAASPFISGDRSPLPSQPSLGTGSAARLWGGCLPCPRLGISWPRWACLLREASLLRPVWGRKLHYRPPGNLPPPPCSACVWEWGSCRPGGVLRKLLPPVKDALPTAEPGGPRQSQNDPWQPPSPRGCCSYSSSSAQSSFWKLWGVHHTWIMPPTQILLLTHPFWFFPTHSQGRKCHESFPNAYAGMSQGSSGLKGGGKGWWKSTSLMCEPVYFFLFVCFDVDHSSSLFWIC